MNTLLIFLLLTLVESVLVYYKVQQMKELGTFGNQLGEAAGVAHKYRPLLDRVVNNIFSFRILLWIPITIVLIINLVLAWILSFAIDLVLFLIEKV